MYLFVSYARADRDIADALVADAGSLGHRAFYDRELVGGQRWWDELLDQIQAAEVFVPVLSDEYRGSEACRAEAAWAQACGVPFLPVTTTAQSPGLYDPVIAEANWIAYDPQSRDALAQLARSLSSVPAVSPPSATPARPPVPVTYLNALEQQVRGREPITRGDQLALVQDLRAKLDTRDQDVAKRLLAALRARPDTTHEAATQIDALLGDDRRSPSSEPAVTSTTPATAGARGPRLPQPVRVGLVGAGVLLLVVALTLLPWAPYRLYRGTPVHRPRLWEGSSIIASQYVLLAIVVAVLVSGLAVASLVVRVPGTVRLLGSGLGLVVAAVAVVRTSTASLAVSGGSGVWTYAVAMTALAAGTLFVST